MKVFCKKRYTKNSEITGCATFEIKLNTFCEFIFSESKHKNYDGAIINNDINVQHTWCFIKDEEFKEHFCTEQEIRKIKLKKLNENRKNNKYQE